MVAHAAQIGMITTLVTNGALLTQKRVDALAEAGLASVYISIDAASCAARDSNRGLPGLSARIRRANTALKRHQIPSTPRNGVLRAVVAGNFLVMVCILAKGSGDCDITRIP